MFHEEKVEKNVAADSDVNLQFGTKSYKHKFWGYIK